jgi:hypothetical protein
MMVLSMKYLELLKSDSEHAQRQIEVILKKFKVQPVGTGYIDLITLNDFIGDFIEELTAASILIEGVTWWCHCTDDSRAELGCPHGMGGPMSRFFNGSFFETHIQMFEIANKDINDINSINLTTIIPNINSQILKYIKNEFIQSDEYLECLVPALWLSVPRDWKRINYYTKNSYTNDY